MKTIIYTLFLGALLSPSALAASDSDIRRFYEPKPLDGVTIEAVESYPNPRSNEMGLGIGLYPFNPYYTAVLINANYLFNLSRLMQWEIVNASYAYTFDKGLTTELADRFNVNPKVIDRMQMMISSNVLFSHSNGKFVYRGEHIRYFRSSALVGLGLVSTSQRNNIVGNFGVRFEVFTGEAFSWRFDIRDSLAPTDGFTQYVTFILGSSFSF